MGTNSTDKSPQTNHKFHRNRIDVNGDGNAFRHELFGNQSPLSGKTSRMGSDKRATVDAANGPVNLEQAQLQSSDATSSQNRQGRKSGSGGSDNGAVSSEKRTDGITEPHTPSLRANSESLSGDRFGSPALEKEQGHTRSPAGAGKEWERGQGPPAVGGANARGAQEAQAPSKSSPSSAEQAVAPKEIVFPASDHSTDSVAGIAKESSSQMAYTKDSPAYAPPPAKPIGEEVAKRSVAFRVFISNDSILNQQPKATQISSADPVPAGDGQRESKKKLAEGETHEAHAQAQHEAAAAHASAPAAAPEQRESNKQNGEHALTSNAAKSDGLFQQSAKDAKDSKDAKPRVLDTQGRSDAGTMRSTEQPVKDRRIDIAGDGAQAPRVPFRFSDDHKEPSSDALRWTQYGTKTVPVPGEHIDPPTFRGTANIRSDGNPFIAPHEGGSWGGTAGGARGGERVIGGKSDGLVGDTGGRTTIGESKKPAICQKPLITSKLSKWLHVNPRVE